MNHHEKTVGIIGGMGPEATVDLMQQVIAGTPANGDIDHIHMLVDNNPKIPSRIKAIIEGTGESPVPVLVAMAQGLETQGANFLVIPCNTAHHYYNEIAASVSIPVLNIIEIAAKHSQQQQPDLTKVGLLASSALQKIKLYEPWFAQFGVEVAYPDAGGQQAVMDLICAVKANKQTAPQIEAYNLAAQQLAEQGVQCLMIACTELSVIADQLHTKLPVYDASKLLAQAIIHTALNK